MNFHFDIRAHCMDCQDSVFWDYLNAVCLQSNSVQYIPKKMRGEGGDLTGDLLVKPANRELLCVMHDKRVEDDSMLGALNLQFGRRVRCEWKKNQYHARMGDKWKEKPP